MNGSRFVFELGPTAATSDHVTIASTLTFTGSGQAIIDLINGGAIVGNDYSLLSFASQMGISAANFVLGDVPPDFVGYFTVTNNEVILHVSSLPDSGSNLLLLTASVALLAFGRRLVVQAAFARGSK
jgi:hypothetical protein